MCFVIRARDLPADPIDELPDARAIASPEVGGCCLDRGIDLDQGGLEHGDALEAGPRLAMETR